MRSEGSFALLLLCFFLSGLAGLIYSGAATRRRAGAWPRPSRARLATRPGATLPQL